MTFGSSLAGVVNLLDGDTTDLTRSEGATIRRLSRDVFKNRYECMAYLVEPVAELSKVLYFWAIFPTFYIFFQLFQVWSEWISEMLGKKVRRWTLPILCVLFATCGGSPVKDEKGPTTTVVPTTATEAEVNATLKCPPSAHRAIVERDEYQTLPNGTLLVSNSSQSANASSYTVGGDGAAPMCLPPTDSEINSIVNPICYALASVFFHLQVPAFIYLTRAFNRWSSMIGPTFFFFHLAVYFAQPFTFCKRGDLDLWYNLPSHLTVSTFNMAGGLVILHSDYALYVLAGWQQIFVKKGNVYISKMAIISKITACSAVVLFCLSYVFAYCAAYGDHWTKKLRSSMPFFLPNSILYLTVNTMVMTYRYFGIPQMTLDDSWRRVRQRYLPYSSFFIGAFANWTFGLAITVSQFWRLWDIFATLSLILPLGLFWYIYENSRRVIYRSRECFKVLETNGDVLTVWIHPPNRQEKNGKQPADKETGAGEKEKLPVDKESGTVEGKQPTDKEYNMRFVAEGTGKDKELVMVVDGPDKDEARQLSREAYDVAACWYPHLSFYSEEGVNIGTDNGK